MILEHGMSFESAVHMLVSFMLFLFMQIDEVANNFNLKFEKPLYSSMWFDDLTLFPFLL